MKGIRREIELKFILSFQIDFFKLFFRNVYYHFFFFKNKRNSNDCTEKNDNHRLNLNNIRRQIVFSGYGFIHPFNIFGSNRKINRFAVRIIQV